jgi:DNA repair protein RAD5
LIYYGDERKSNINNLGTYDAVITTYGTISHEFSKGFHLTKNGIYKMHWERIILDEAHYIKGRIIQTAKAVYELDGLYRWCLTGTPIQNNLTDLFSLVHFIRYTPWS